MNRGQLRSKIIDKCPDEFKGDLSDWMDSLESMVGDVLDGFDVTCLDDLHKLVDAKESLDEIKKALW